MAFPICEREAPREASDLMNNSSETDLSAVSIFAIRDWLDPIRLANCSWVRRLSCRKVFSLEANASFIATIISSAGLSSRKSDADPTVQPAFTSFFCFAGFTLMLGRTV